MIFTLVSTGGRLSPAELRFDERLAYAGGKLWIAPPQYGLYRRGDAGWTAIPTGETPLPGDQTTGSYNATTRHNIPAVFWRYMREQPVD
ncbi:MAG TPA: hypothetical protein VLA19_06325 [Herpetosiphonaceae bacterium]|nr:hypothetical protein [Herpetosiphonaceae bacterium]